MPEQNQVRRHPNKILGGGLLINQAWKRGGETVQDNTWPKRQGDPNRPRQYMASANRAGKPAKMMQWPRQQGPQASQMLFPMRICCFYQAASNQTLPLMRLMSLLCCSVKGPTCFYFVPASIPSGVCQTTLIKASSRLINPC